MCVVKELELFRVCLDIVYIKLVFYPFQVHNSKLNYMHMLRCTNMGCKIIYVCMGLWLSPMQEMRMKFEHDNTVALRQTSMYFLL